jgi:DNA-binding MarR family transcriptional regulator
MHLLKSKEPLSMTQISTALGMPKPNITVLADKLIEKKFAERLQDNHDRRIVMIALTKKGYDFLEYIHSTYQEQIKKKLEILPEKEMEQFADALLVVRNTLTTLKSLE